jgi:receptor tyrosine-protein kinase erbB-3
MLMTHFQVLHRDLALRNILLKGDFNIKIADFGLSRITKGGIYIVGNPETALPIVSPLEATPPVGGAVGLKADWWTFGVLLWEIFNLGAEQPFEKNRSSRLSMINFLENGNHLNYPKFAPHEMYVSLRDMGIFRGEEQRLAKT